jgi:hypothetical protein
MPATPQLTVTVTLTRQPPATARSHFTDRIFVVVDNHHGKCRLKTHQFQMSLKLSQIQDMKPNKKARVRREADNGARVADHGLESGADPGREAHDHDVVVRTARPAARLLELTAAAKSAAAATAASALVSSTLLPPSPSFRIPLTAGEKDRRKERKVRELLKVSPSHDASYPCSPLSKGALRGGARREVWNALLCGAEAQTEGD